MNRPRLLVAALAALLASFPLAAAAETVIKLTPHDEDTTSPGRLGLLPNTDSSLTGSNPADDAASRSGHSSSYDPIAVDEQPTLQTRHFGAQIDLQCARASQPGGLVVINRGQEPLPAGTRIKWQFRGAGLRGFFALVGELDAGASLVADDILEGGVEPQGDCSARAI